MRRTLRTEHIAWQKYKQWQKVNVGKIREGQTITSLGEFQAIYNEVGRRIDSIKFQVTHQMSEKTYRALSKMYREYTTSEENPRGKALPRSVTAKSTREIAALFKDDISNFYHKTKDEAIKQGKSAYQASKEAKLAVSRYYFGS